MCRSASERMATLRSSGRVTTTPRTTLYQAHPGHTPDTSTPWLQRPPAQEHLRHHPTRPTPTGPHQPLNPQEKGKERTLATSRWHTGTSVVSPHPRVEPDILQQHSHNTVITLFCLCMFPFPKYTKGTCCEASQSAPLKVRKMASHHSHVTRQTPLTLEW